MDECERQLMLSKLCIERKYFSKLGIDECKRRLMQRNIYDFYIYSYNDVDGIIIFTNYVVGASRQLLDVIYRIDWEELDGGTSLLISYQHRIGGLPLRTISLDQLLSFKIDAKPL